MQARVLPHPSVDTVSTKWVSEAIANWLVREEETVLVGKKDKAEHIIQMIHTD